MEPGEVKELCLMSAESLHETVLEWLREIMAGEDFIYEMQDRRGAYTFTWDLPNMMHRVTSGFHEYYGATPAESKTYPRLEGKSGWGKLVVQRIR